MNFTDTGGSFGAKSVIIKGAYGRLWPFLYHLDVDRFHSQICLD